MSQVNRTTKRICTSYGLATDELWDIASSCSTSGGEIELYQAILKYPQSSQHEFVQSFLLMDCSSSLEGNESHFRAVESLIVNCGLRLPFEALGREYT